MKHVARKVAAMEGGLVGFRGGITMGMQFPGQVDLYMTSIDHGYLYKQSVEYCCGSLLSSLVNTQLMFLLDIHPKRFIICTFIGHWSSGCHNKLVIVVSYPLSYVGLTFYNLVSIIRICASLEYKNIMLYILNLISQLILS